MLLAKTQVDPTMICPNSIRRLFRLFFLTSCLFVLVGSAPAHAFDLFGKEQTYLRKRSLQLFGGMGLLGLVSDRGVESDGMDLGYRIGVGYSWTRRLRLEFLWQFGWVPVTSPDPLNGGDFNSKFIFHSEIWRFLYRYDRFALVPYGGLGVGFYQFASVNPQTGLSFPEGFQMPITVGLESYLYKDHLSFTLEYNYHLIFDENQNVGTLGLLNLPAVNFDVHGIMFNLYWHLF